MAAAAAALLSGALAAGASVAPALASPVAAAGPHAKADRALAASVVRTEAGVTISDADLGNLDLPGGYRTPVRGVLALPAELRPRQRPPLILIAHLRSPGCTTQVEAFPCPRGTREIRYDRGMTWLAQRLAARGYAVLVPDLAPLYIPRGTDSPYRQDAALAALFERMIDEVRSGGKAFGVDTGAVATGRLGLVAHSRSGLLGDELARAWRGGPHPIEAILAYGPSYALARTSDDGTWSPPHPDVPYYALMGTADADTDTEPVELLTHHLTAARTAPAFVQTVVGFGHNYVNRALSATGTDDRTDCATGCPDAAAHESLLGQAATSWFAATLRAQPSRLPMRAQQWLPTRMFGQDGRFLAVSNARGRVSLVAGERSERVRSSGVSTQVCRFLPPMAPPQSGRYCPDDRLGSFAAYDVSLRRIAWRGTGYVRWQVPAAAADTGAIAFQLGPGADLPVGRVGTPVRLVVQDTSGARFTANLPEGHPALANRKSTAANGAYQVGTIRVNLDAIRGWRRADGRPRQLASVQLGGTGRPGVILVRSIDLMPR